MKKHILFSVIIAAAISSKAQVGIGTTTPNSSAMLDVSSNNKGFLVPRMGASARLTIPSPAEGLLVYQTDNPKGYYYYNGTAWQLLVTPGWRLSGNTNIDYTDFLGTTDFNDLYFKTNGELSGRISPDQYATFSLGYQAGLNNVASFVTAIGYKAVSSANSGNHVTGVGYLALQRNNAAFNTAVGSLALSENSIGTNSVAVGAWALKVINGGNNNVAIGANAMSVTTAGSSNTFVGSNTGSGMFSGNQNTAVGHNAGANFSGALNTTSIGYAAVPTGNDRVRIGNTSVTEIGGQTVWYNLSDVRFKKDIREQEHGLDFIMQLKPITYHTNVEKLNQFIYGDKTDSLFGSPAAKASIARKESILYSGFSAQQVEEAAQKVGFEFSGVHKPESEKDHYSLAYASFVVPLVKGMQEQQALIEALNAKNELLQKEIEQLKRQMKELMKTANE